MSRVTEALARITNPMEVEMEAKKDANTRYPLECPKCGHINWALGKYPRDCSACDAALPVQGNKFQCECGATLVSLTTFFHCDDCNRIWNSEAPRVRSLRYKSMNADLIEMSRHDPSFDADPIRCACCSVKTKMVLKQSQLARAMCLQPDTNGWMRSFFPWKDSNFQSAAIVECSWLCPHCGTETMKFIAHRRVPMLDDEDLL